VRCNVPDTMMAGLAEAQVFFFERALDEARLAAGLARALEHLPVFAGQIREAGGVLEIVCDDTGAPMTTIDAGENLAEAIGRVTLPGSGLIDHIDARLARSGGQPLLRIRITRLADGGMAVGCSWQHAVGDMQSFVQLMQTWSAAYDGRALPDVKLVDDREANLLDVLPPQDCGRSGIRLLGEDEAANLEREVEAAFMTSRNVQIYFTDAEVARMRAEFGAATGCRLSAADVLCGQVVTAIRRLDEDTEPRKLATAFNFRRTFGMPANLIGNLTNELYLTCAPNSAPETVAAQIRTAIDDFERSHFSLRSSYAFLDEVGRPRLDDCVSVGFDLGQRTFNFNSLARFGVYDISFDGQHPACFAVAAKAVSLPWTSWLVEGFGNTGFIFTVVVPSRLAGRMRSPDGRAALHRFREPGDALPDLVTASKKLL
jgi:transferase family protein